MIYNDSFIVTILLIIAYLVYLSKTNHFKAQTTQKKKWKRPKIPDGTPTIYGWCVRHPENLHLGKNTDIGYGTYIQAENKVFIRDNVQIGAHCSIYSKNTIDGTESPIYIGENVRIGAGTVILPNTGGEPLIIGKNSVIGALSLVKHIIPKDTMYYGIPARTHGALPYLLKKSERTLQNLLKEREHDDN